MLSDKEMLNYIRKGTQMGCFGIDRVINKTSDPEFKSDLSHQRDEYREIYKEADSMLQNIGGKRQNVSSLSKLSAGMMSTFQTMADSSESKIAEMMITGNTMGVTKGLRHLHDYSGRVESIAHKLLETEERNIVQMQQYL